MNAFFNSLGNSLYDSLCNLDHSIHKTDIKGSFVDNFIHELRDYLVKSDVTYRLSKLPKDTFLEINEIEKNFIQCYLNHIEYCIPKDMVYPSDLIGLENDGHIKLQLQEDNLYHVIRFEKGKTIS
ncbi:MAG: hypothetical protein HUJ68_04770 [Clostridia bacterium]|nr:hypothetical protein [Clostridia bacterium]